MHLDAQARLAHAAVEAIHALEPDFHFKPEVELYNLIADPQENRNLAKAEPGVVKMLEERMQAHIARREKETGRTNPIYTNLNWHGQGLRAVQDLAAGLRHAAHRLAQAPPRNSRPAAELPDPARRESKL